MTDVELQRMVTLARQKVVDSRVGCMHAMWDVIMDAEALLQSEPSMLDRPDVEAYLQEFIA